MADQTAPVNYKQMTPAQQHAVRLMRGLQQAVSELAHLPRFKEGMFKPSTVMWTSANRIEEWPLSQSSTGTYVGLVPRQLVQNYLDRVDPFAAELLRQEQECPVVAHVPGSTLVAAVVRIPEQREPSPTRH
jgi:hypothetical protein